MSAKEITITNIAKRSKSEISLSAKCLDYAASVNFGIILLIFVILLCLIGMFVRQENAPDFAVYYASLSPFQQVFYGLLGFFDIYHSWYFSAALALLSLNIILASVERFPKSRTYISEPKRIVSEKWLKAQKLNYSMELQGKKDEIIEKIVSNYKATGWRKISVSGNVIFAESGAWNRLGAYPVHLALLIIFFGGFLTSQLSFSGEVPLSVGQTAKRLQAEKLPFTIICADLEQKLINPKDSIDANNTLDWLTYLQINSEYGTHQAIIGLNKPFDYRGYRIFHSKALPLGKARSATIEYNGENLNFKQNENKILADGTKITFIDFRANFSLEKNLANENSTRYQNPAAVFEIQSPNAAKETVFAQKNSQIKLIDFERVSEQHTLFIRYDPGAKVVYFGFALLSLSIIAVFFFSHQRIWSIFEETSENTFNVTIGGNTNRNYSSFEDKFKRFITKIL